MAALATVIGFGALPGVFGAVISAVLHRANDEAIHWITRKFNSDMTAWHQKWNAYLAHLSKNPSQAPAEWSAIYLNNGAPDCPHNAALPCTQFTSDPSCHLFRLESKSLYENYHRDLLQYERSRHFLSVGLAVAVLALSIFLMPAAVKTSFALASVYMVCTAVGTAVHIGGVRLLRSNLQQLQSVR